MDYFEIKSNSEYQETKVETEAPKSFHILSDKNNDFLITLEKDKDLLTITACKNNFIKNFYKETFTLQYLRNYFGPKYNIEECISEIFLNASQNKGIIKEINKVIELKIPLSSKISSELCFLLKEKEKSSIEKFEQLYELINDLYVEKENQKKEIDELKKKLEEYTHQEIHIIGLDKMENGSSIEINCFDENKFKEFMDIDLNSNNCYLKFLMKFDENKRDNVEKIIENFNKDNKYIISIKDNFINLYSNFPFQKIGKEDEEDKVVEMIKNFLNIKDLVNININFITDLKIKDLFGKKSTKEIIEKFFKMKLIIKGISINIKLLIKSLLDEFIDNNQITKLKEPIVSFIKYFKIALNNKITTLYFNNNDINQIINMKDMENIIKKIQSSIKSEKIKNENSAIDFENFDIFFVIPKFKIGFIIKIYLNSFNEVINNIIEEGKKQNEEDKEIELKEKIKDIKINNKEKKILENFKEEFNLNWINFSDELLIEKLRKNNYNTAQAFSALFD